MGEEPGFESTGDEEDEWDSYSLEDIKDEQQYVDVGRESYSRIEVDLYKTKLHGATIGIRQKDQYMSKSRQFTTNTEVKGEIKFFYGFENRKERDGYTEVLAINEYFWETDKKSKLYEKVKNTYKDYDPGEYSKLMRKLIIKTFIGLDKEHEENKGKWTGSIEESQIMSLAMTFGEKDPLPFFWVNMPGYKYRIPIFRTHATVGERYVFPMIDEETGVADIYYIEAKRFTPGSDFVVRNAATMEKIAWIDDRTGNIGGKVDIQLFEENDDLNRNRIFVRVLVLFAGASKYFHDLYKNYNKIYEAMSAQEQYRRDIKRKTDKGGDIAEVNEKYRKAMEKMKFLKEYQVSGYELSLHYNPRRVRT